MGGEVRPLKLKQNMMEMAFFINTSLNGAKKIFEMQIGVISVIV